MAAKWTDQELSCVACGVPFIWTAGQQQFYAQRDLQTPKRCDECRRSPGRTYRPREVSTVTRTCRGCRASFEIHPAEQRGCLERTGNLDALPTRCKTCRATRRDEARKDMR